MLWHGITISTLTFPYFIMRTMREAQQQKGKSCLLFYCIYYCSVFGHGFGYDFCPREGRGEENGDRNGEGKGDFTQGYMPTRNSNRCSLVYCSISRCNARESTKSTLQIASDNASSEKLNENEVKVVAVFAMEKKEEI